MIWKNWFKRTLPENTTLNSNSKADQIKPVSLDGDFYRLLEQERSQADRSGREFSLVLFECRSEPSDHALLQEFWQITHRLLRPVDKACWLSDGRLGVVLPETRLVSARKLAEDIGRVCEAVLPDFSYKIYTYQPHSGAGEIEEILKALK